MCHKCLAGAGLTLDQHMAVGLPQIENILAKTLHHRRSADQLLHKPGAVRQLPPQRPVVQCQPPRIGGFFGQLGHLVRVERLFQEIERAHLHGLDSHGHIAVPGDHDHRQRTVDAHQALQETHPVHARHFDIADDHTLEIRRQSLQCVLGTAIGFGFKPREGQPLADRLTHILFVIDNRDLHGLGHRSNSVCHSAASLLCAASGRVISNTAPPA